MDDSGERDDWLEHDLEAEPEDDIPIDEYDLTSTPNDFNIKTIVDFLERGVFKVPAFQRNYVWEARRASKLIESLLMGLPVPQLFLYEQGKNDFLVVDGQQRLLSIFYFTRKRFPRLEKRSALRRIFDEKGKIPDEILSDDEYFLNFKLKLPSKLPSQKSRFDGLNYDTLGPEDQTTFDLRTLRCVVIKQNKPDDEDSSVYEIFNRLNTGGMNLTPQEIRTSLFHSEFYKMLYRLNALPEWRDMVGLRDPDLRMRDVEVLLRGFAMLMRGEEYRPSMTRFLNAFSKSMRKVSGPELQSLEDLFRAFLAAAAGLPQGIFGTRSRKMNVSIFESVFSAACRAMWRGESTTVLALSQGSIENLKADAQFVEAASTKSTNRDKVETRLTKARESIGGSDGPSSGNVAS